MISDSANATRWRSWSGARHRVAEPDVDTSRCERRELRRVRQRRYAASSNEAGCAI